MMTDIKNPKEEHLTKKFYDITTEIDLSEGIDLPKTNNSKECMICQ